MRVEQLMTQDVKCCGPGDSLQTAAKLMWDHDCGCVPVATGSHLVGMITDRDICMAVMHADARPSEVAVERVMSSEVHSCRPNDSVEAAEKLLEVYQIRRLPVVDGDGGLVGLLSLNDIAREAERERTQRQGAEVGIEGVAEAYAAICVPRHAAA